MGALGPDGASTNPTGVGEAYAAARELLRRAEDDAARIRADADRYLRQRQMEAELVVAKARRMLAIAEERAAALVAGAPLPASSGPVQLTEPAWDLDPDAPVAIDLRDHAVAPAEPAGPPGRAAHSELDHILASAVSRAIDRALPVQP